MRNKVVVAILMVVVVMAFVVGPVSAQTRTAGAAGTTTFVPPKVVLLDVQAFFKQYDKFNDLMADLKDDVTAAGKSLQEKKAELDAQIQRLPELRQNPEVTPTQYKGEEERLAKLNADLQIRMRMQQVELMEREAKIHLQIYQELQNEITQYAAARNVDLVLRVDARPVDEDDPKSVLARVSNPVVWYRTNMYMDITGTLTGVMNQRYAQVRDPKYVARQGVNTTTN